VRPGSFSVCDWLGSDAGLLRQDLFGDSGIDLDRQSRDEWARATVAGENPRAGDEEFRGAQIFCRGNKCSVLFQQKGDSP